MRVFKTLVVSLDGGELAVAVIPVSSMLSMKLVARAFGAKKATMADKSDVERSAHSPHLETPSPRGVSGSPASAG